MLFPHFECYGNEILAGFKSRSNYTMQLFASVRITAFRRRNYCVRASINQQIQIKLAFHQNYCYLAFNYTCWKSVLLVLGSRFEPNLFMKLNKQIKPLNAAVIIQLKLFCPSEDREKGRRCTHVQEWRGTHAFITDIVIAATICFSQWLQRHAGITPPTPAPTPASPRHPFPQDIS